MIGKEYINLKGSSSFETWIVEVPGSAGVVRYWVTKEAPYLLRAESIKAGGGMTVFEIENWQLRTGD